MQTEFRRLEKNVIINAPIYVKHGAMDWSERKIYTTRLLLHFSSKRFGTYVFLKDFSTIIIDKHLDSKDKLNIIRDGDGKEKEEV